MRCITGCLIWLGLGVLPGAWAQPLYICQSGNKAVYTSYPAKLPQGRCRPSALQASPAASVAVQNSGDDADDPIRQLWYDLEFGRIDDNIGILPPSPPPVSRPATTPAAVPPQLTPKQMVVRDMANETRALRHTEEQWQRARQHGDGNEVRRLGAAIADRQQNIRALQEELRRY